MLVSSVQRSDSVTHVHVCILFQILFPFRLLYNIEQSSPCCTVGPCWLSNLNIAVCLIVTWNRISTKFDAENLSAVNRLWFHIPENKTHESKILNKTLISK